MSPDADFAGLLDIDMGDAVAGPAGGSPLNMGAVIVPPTAFAAVPPAAAPAPVPVPASPSTCFDDAFEASKKAVQSVFTREVATETAGLRLELAVEKKRADDATAGAQTLARFFPDMTPDQVEEQVDTWKQSADAEVRLRQFLQIPDEVATFDMLGRAFNAVQSGLATVSDRETLVVQKQERNATEVAASKRELAEGLDALRKRLCVS